MQSYADADSTCRYQAMPSSTTSVRAPLVEAPQRKCISESIQQRFFVLDMHGMRCKIVNCIRGNPFDRPLSLLVSLFLPSFLLPFSFLSPSFLLLLHYPKDPTTFYIGLMVDRDFQHCVSYIAQEHDMCIATCIDCIQASNSLSSGTGGRVQ